MKKGFTLVELLVVIAIIGVLAAAVLVSLAGTRPKARDARRRADLQNVSKAIQLYADDNTGTEEGVPFPASGNNTVGDMTSANANYGTAGAVLVSKYLQSLPIDPSSINGGAPPTPIYGYGYVAVDANGTTLSAAASTAVRFRLGAYAETGALPVNKNYDIWSATPTGDIVVAQ